MATSPSGPDCSREFRLVDSRAVILGAVRRLNWGAVRHLSSARLKAIGAVSILLAFGAWAMSSPVGSSPDEDFHLTSIWCSHGAREGSCEPGTGPDTRTVRRDLVDAPCFAYKPDESAACQGDFSSPEMVVTDRGNFDGLYPPVFYYVQGFLVGDDVVQSVMLMRLLNVVLFVALFTAVYLMVPTRLRGPMLLASLLTAVPLGMFLVPSINPSGWAILAAATVFVSILGYLTTENRRHRLMLGGLAALALLIGAGARADAAIFGVVAIATASILTVRRGSSRAGYVRDNRRLIYPLVLAVVAVLSFFTAGQSSFADPGASATQSFSFGRLVRTALDVPILWIGGMGAPAPTREFDQPGWPWGLGWLDTAMPGVVWVGLWGVYAAVLFIAVTGADRRRVLAISVAGVAAIFIPAYIQYLADTPVGGMIQPRYVLPLLTILVATATVRLNGPTFRLTSAQRWIVVVVLCLANAAALYANLRRYVTGNASAFWNLDRAPAWWWSIPISPLTVFVVGSLAFSVGVVLLSKDFTAIRPSSEEPVSGAVDPDLGHSSAAEPGGITIVAGGQESGRLVRHSSAVDQP